MIVNYVFVFMLYNNWWKKEKKYNDIDAIVYHNELRTANIFLVSWLLLKFFTHVWCGLFLCRTDLQLDTNKNLPYLSTSQY